MKSETAMWLVGGIALGGVVAYTLTKSGSEDVTKPLSSFFSDVFYRTTAIQSEQIKNILQANVIQSSAFAEAIQKLQETNVLQQTNLLEAFQNIANINAQAIVEAIKSIPQPQITLPTISVSTPPINISGLDTSALTNLQNQLTQSLSEKTQLANTINDLKNQIANLSQYGETYKDKIAQLQSQLSDYASKLTASEDIIKNLQNQIDNLKSKAQDIVDKAKEAVDTTKDVVTNPLGALGQTIINTISDWAKQFPIHSPIYYWELQRAE